MVHDIYDIAHMGGEGRETLLDALFISNIGKYIIKYIQSGTIQCRNMKSGLSHQSKQTQCF